MKRVFVSGSFDDLRSHHIRFLEEAARLGELTVVLWIDELVRSQIGRYPKFPLIERQYLLQAIRYVDHLLIAPETMGPDEILGWEHPERSIWAMLPEEENLHRKQFCARQGITLHAIPPGQLVGFPQLTGSIPGFSGRKKVFATGCFDWLHSGHVRFFEQISQLGDVYVGVGHDANIRLLKGEGHPLFSQGERRYQVQAIRYVTQALITSGHGWLDAEPEIERLRPDIYAVNKDGDKPEKRQYCAEHDIQYVVMKRTPAAGLPARASTTLRGF